MDKYCPLADKANAVCDRDLCAWFDAESERCAIAAIPEALDVLTRFCLTDTYEAPPWEDD